MAVIVDVIDANRALVNSLDFNRCQVNFKNIILTGLKVEIPRGAGKAVLRKVLAKESTVAKFNDLQAVKKIEMLRKRAKMTDFDRFRVFVAKRQTSLHVRQEVNKLKKANAKAGIKPKAKKVKKAVEKVVEKKKVVVPEKTQHKEKKKAV